MPKTAKAEDDLQEAVEAEVTRLDGVHGPASGAGFMLLRSKPVDNVQRDDFAAVVADVASGGNVPGSPAWEADDAARLREITQGLLPLIAKLETARAREDAESAFTGEYEWEETDALYCALDALNAALRAVAAMSFTEQAEADGGEGVERAGKRLSTKSVSSLDAAITALTQLRDGAAPTPTETPIVSTETEAVATADQPVERTEEQAAPETVTAPAPVAEASVETPVERSAETPQGESLVDQLKRAVSDAVKAEVAPLQDALKRAEERLEKIETTPLPGGPVANANVVLRGQGGETDDPLAEVRRNIAEIARRDPQKGAELGVMAARASMPKYPVPQQ